MSYAALIAATCNGLTYAATGLFVCGGSISAIKIHLPTETQGQYRLVNPNIDYGVFDFNIVYKEKGWWLWKKKFLPVGLSPEVIIDSVDQQLPKSLGILGQGLGHSAALIDSFKNSKPIGNLEVSYSCGSKQLLTGTVTGWSYGEGVGGCIALEGSTSNISFVLDTGITNIDLISEGCQFEQHLTVNKVTKFNFPFIIQNKMCSLYLQTRVGESIINRAKLVFYGYSADEFIIAEPVMYDKRIFKPIGAVFIGVENYIKGGVSKRVKTTEQVLDVSWFNDGDLCAFAYADNGQTSYTCYNKNGEEIPKYFK